MFISPRTLCASERRWRQGRRLVVVSLGELLFPCILFWAATAQAGILNLSWFPPTTMTNAAQLTNLSSYRVYIGTSSTLCPGPAFHQVPSPTPTPASGDIINTQIAGLATGTTYLVQVTAVDTEGNESDCSNQASGQATDSLDATSPNGNVTINNNAPYTRSTTATLNLTAVDGVGVTGYYLSINSARPSVTATGWMALAPTTNYSNPAVPFTLPGGNGTKTVYAWFKDAAGNVSSTVSDTIVLDQVAPTVSLTAPAAGQTVSGAVTISATATDTNGVAGVQFMLDGVNLLSEDTTSPFSLSWNTATATEGSHTLTAVARDVAGNTTTSAAVTVTVSNRHPVRRGQAKKSSAAPSNSTSGTQW